MPQNIQEYVWFINNCAFRVSKNSWTSLADLFVKEGFLDEKFHFINNEKENAIYTILEELGLWDWDEEGKELYKLLLERIDSKTNLYEEVQNLLGEKKQELNYHALYH